MAPCSVAVLLGAALLLLAPGGTQALGSPSGEDADMEQDLKEILLGQRAVEPPEEGEQAEDAGAGSPRVRAGPEEDRDHLYHPAAEAEEPRARGWPLALSAEVRNGPEEDRDHLYHS